MIVMRALPPSRWLAAAAAAIVWPLVAGSYQAPAAAAGASSEARTAPKFYDDDPIRRVVDPQDASKAAPR